MKAWGSYDRARGRKTALNAVKALRGVRKQMASDPGVGETTISQLAGTLDLMDDVFGHIFPDPGAVSEAVITGVFESDD